MSHPRHVAGPPWHFLILHGTLQRMVPTEAKSLSQLRRGVLEYCVLSLLSSTSLYAFDLVRRLSEADGVVISEGTIYPLLSRLRREGWVSTTWAESVEGPPRRYYALTPAGERALLAFTADWRRFRDAVDAILPKERHDQ
jgi:PadR family transcriptional regulator, regulatory protein PadR